MSMTYSAVFFQLQSFAIICLMLFGIKLIKENMRRRHIQTMGVAMVWDILLILQIELSRNAIATAAGPSSNTMILNIHVAIAVSCVFLYAAMLGTGLNLLKGKTQLRKIHKNLGLTTLVMRILTFATSFFTV